MIKVKAILRLDKPLSNDAFPIWIRITNNRKSRYISLGYSCLEEEWDSSSSKLWESKPRITDKEKAKLNSNEIKDLRDSYSGIKINSLAKRINAEIDRKIRSLLDIKDYLEATNKTTSAENIKIQSIPKVEDNNKPNSGSFIEYWKKQNVYIEKSLAYPTYKNYVTSLNILSEFIKDNLKVKDLLFEEIDHNFLELYHVYLIEKGNRTDTIHKYLRNLKTILYKAIKDKLIAFENNPFFTFKLKQEKDKVRIRLTSEEIESIKKLDIPSSERLWHTRNMFLFSYYNAGIRVGDLLKLKWENISKDGRLVYLMNKNKKGKDLKLSKDSLAILNKYKEDSKGKKIFIFPFLEDEYINYNEKALFSKVQSNTTYINLDLKEIAMKAKIDKNLTSHISRHSFADLARRKNASLYDINKLMAHGSLATTEKYLASFDIVSQDKAHESIFED